MRTVNDLNFSGKKAVVRVDFNVPLNANFEITDDARIAAAVPTVKKILNDGGSAILMSHLGRPKEGFEEKFSLKHLVNHLAKLTGATVHFANDCIGREASEKATSLNAGEILLLENLRFYKEETAGDVEFSKKLASLGDIYVNDAFGTAHRAHASTAVMAQFFGANKCFGYIMADEVANAEKVMGNPEKPFVAIVGGAKVSDKLLIIENLMNVADTILIGGGMAYTFKAAEGGKIGNSLFEADRVELTKELMAKAKAKGVNLVLPVDSVCADGFTNDGGVSTCNSDSISDGWMGLDIGEKAVKEYTDIIKNAKTILWNGPMGVFEFSNFENGTKAVALAVAEATKAGAFSLIGGGDSAAAIKKFNLVNEVSYVSTGGGALLEYFEGKELPGIAAIAHAATNG
ncbi:MAG: phosphoglycerate kinase [Flavobacteriales bacterium]|nr:phosphoglycerate kinase [Flavobacteriales bacterium]